MLWFIPTTHKVVIAALLVVAFLALVAFSVTRVVARRRRSAEREMTAQAAIRHGVRTPDSPPPRSRNE